MLLLNHNSVHQVEFSELIQIDFHEYTILQSNSNARQNDECEKNYWSVDFYFKAQITTFQI